MFSRFVTFIHGMQGQLFLFLDSDSPYILWSQASGCPLLALGPFVLLFHTDGAGPLGCTNDLEVTVCGV